MPTPADFTTAVQTEYPDSLELSTGYFVINSLGEVVRWSLGASRLFGTTEEEMLETKSGERLREIHDFLPESMTREKHTQLIAREFDLLEQAINSGETYTSMFMAARDGEIRYMDGRDAEGKEISFGIHTCPLFVEGKPYILSFVTRNPDDTEEDSANAATVESTAVLKNAQLRLADQVASTTGRNLAGLYAWLENNPYRALPMSVRPLAAFFTLIAVVVMLVTPVAYFAYVKWIAAPTQIHQWKIPEQDDAG